MPFLIFCRFCFYHKYVLGTESEYLTPKLMIEAIESKVHSNMIPSYDALPFSQEFRTRRKKRKTEQKWQPVGLKQFLTKMVIFRRKSVTFGVNY